MKNKILELNRLTSVWLSNVNLYGNECASTDRLVESIIKIAKELENKYDEEVPPVKINKYKVELIDDEEEDE